MRVVFSKPAEGDIDSILDYTIEKWGTQQAIKYKALLQHAIDTLAASPKIGMQQNHLGEGMRRFVVEKHIILYREEAEILVIHRIYHQRRHLDALH